VGLKEMRIHGGAFCESSNVKGDCLSRYAQKQERDALYWTPLSPQLCPCKGLRFQLVKPEMQRDYSSISNPLFSASAGMQEKTLRKFQNLYLGVVF